MKSIYIFYTAILTFFITACSLNEDAGLNRDEVVTGFDGTFVLEDRVGRPAINTALINEQRKDAFNITLTKDLNSNFKEEIEAEIIRFSPAFNVSTDTNVLGQTASDMANLLATDVLGVSLVGTTTFFDGTNVLTGRMLSDDVMDVELLLIFGGNDGSQNPTLAPSDYQKYLSFSDTLQISKAQRKLRFWSDKYAESPNQYVYLDKLAQIHESLFELNGKIEHLKKAEKYFEKSIQISDSSDTGVLQHLARNYISQHKFKECLPLLKKAHSIGYQTLITNQILFDVYLELGNTTKARNLFKNMVLF